MNTIDHLVRPALLGSATPTAWEYILTYGSFFVVVGGFIALSYWGYRRRRSGVEASSSVTSPRHRSDPYHKEYDWE